MIPLSQEKEKNKISYGGGNILDSVSGCGEDVPEGIPVDIYGHLRVVKCQAIRVVDLFQFTGLDSIAFKYPF